MVGPEGESAAVVVGIMDVCTVDFKPEAAGQGTCNE